MTYLTFNIDLLFRMSYWINLVLYFRIVSRPAKLEISLTQQAPSLQNEFYLIQVTVTNKEEVDIKKAW